MDFFNINLPVVGIEFNVMLLLTIGFCVGVPGGFSGVGGGFIIMPALVYLIGLPTIVAVGIILITVFFCGAYGCFTYALKGRVKIVAAFIMIIGASIGAQIGATAVKFIRGYGIRLLFAIMIIFAGLPIVTEQFYKMTSKPLFQTFAEIVLMGTALTMTTIVISRLVIESKKEKSLKINN